MASLTTTLAGPPLWLLRLLNSNPVAVPRVVVVVVVVVALGVAAAAVVAVARQSPRR